MSDNMSHDNIQAVLLDKTKYTLKQSSEWIKKHNYNPIKPVHITDKYYRYRIHEPNTFSQMRIVKLKNGVNFIVGYKK